MAQLAPLILFSAGTPAIADDVNQNFADIRNHINGANIDTENIAATLTSRSGSPILYLNQTSENQIVLSIQNSQTNTAMQILQSAALSDSSKAVLKIESSVQQTLGKAELWLNLAGTSTIPAILVEHGTTTMSLTKTQLNLFASSIQATSAGVLSATTVNATTVGATNVNTSGTITATAPTSDSIAIKVKGRSSDNQSQIVLKSNDDATTYAEITTKTTGVELNLPDTADSLTVKVNNVTKAVIDNNGIDATYLYNTNLASNTSDLITDTFGTMGPDPVEPAIKSVTLTTIRLNQKVILSFGPDTDTIINSYRGPNTTGDINLGGWRIIVTGPGGFSLTTRYGHNSGGGPTGEAITMDTRVITLSAIGTYTFTLYPHRSRSSGSYGGFIYGWVITNHRIYVSSVFG